MVKPRTPISLNDIELNLPKFGQEPASAEKQISPSKAKNTSPEVRNNDAK